MNYAGMSGGSSTIQFAVKFGYFDFELHVNDVRLLVLPISLQITKSYDAISQHLQKNSKNANQAFVTKKMQFKA